MPRRPHHEAQGGKPSPSIALNSLNAKQRDAVMYSQSPTLLIQAGPGSGKTRTLIYRISYHITAGLAPGSLLAMTFTNKAAEELQERIIALLGDRGKGIVAGTFHSICLRLLRRYADRIGLHPNFSILDADDAEQYIADCASRIDCHVPRRTLVTFISKSKSLQIEPERLVEVAAEVLTSQHLPMAGQIAAVYAVYRDRLLDDNLVDFDDLLLQGLKLLRCHPQALGHVRAIFVDEFQDTSGLQYDLIKEMARNSKLTVVGDSDQSIYGWRQADSRNARKLLEDFPGCGVIALDTTYRSTECITEICKHIIAQDVAEATYIAQEIERLLHASNGMLKYNDVAILARRNAQREPVEKALLASGIPYRVVAGSSVIDRKEAKDMLAFFALAVGVEGAVERMAVQRCVNLVYHISQKEYERPAGSKRRPPKKSINSLITLSAQRGLSLLNAAQQAISKRQLPQLTTELRDMLKVVDSARQEFETTRTISSTLLAITTALDLEAFIHREHGDKPHEERRRVQVVRDVVEMGAAFDSKANVDGDADVLRRFLDMSTIGPGGTTRGSNNGLEWPIVFVIGLEDTEMPSSIHGQSELTPERLAEERRTLYVGLTRSAMVLEMTWHRKPGLGASRVSRFLHRVPHECYSDQKYMRLDRANWLLFGKLLDRPVPAKTGMDGDHLPPDALAAEEELKQRAERKVLDSKVLLALHGGFVGAKNVPSSKPAEEEQLAVTTARKHQLIPDHVEASRENARKKIKKTAALDGQRKITDMLRVFRGCPEIEAICDDDEISEGFDEKEKPRATSQSPRKRSTLAFTTWTGTQHRHSTMIDSSNFETLDGAQPAQSIILENQSFENQSLNTCSTADQCPILDSRVPGAPQLQPESNSRPSSGQSPPRLQESIPARTPILRKISRPVNSFVVEHSSGQSSRPRRLGARPARLPVVESL
ncbi:hypothetical protein HDU93_007518 [Gonapodya sp. JEL0774]|nr:hypothetical protein HDU93_007518 [Gonapodya sp. JEL0774]